FTNAPAANEVYYIGVKSEDQQAAEYTFLAVSSNQAFNTPNADGTISFLGIPVQQPIPDGTPDQPGVGLYLALGLDPREIRLAFVRQFVSHPAFPDLVGSVFHNNQAVVLHNHRPLHDVDAGQLFGGTNVLAIFDDLDTGLYPGSRPSDGPGRLVEFMGRPGGGVWILQTVDNALGNQGRVEGFDLRVFPNDFGTGFVRRTAPPGGCVHEVVNVPPDASRLRVVLTNINPAYPLEVHIRREELPDTSNPENNDRNATITPPGGTVSIGVRDVPPLTAGRYFIAVCNPNAVAVNYDIARFLDLDLGTNFNRTLASGPSQNIALPDMARATSTIVVDDNRPVSAVEVGLRVTHPRQSDLAVHLVNPQGQRALLTENRGRLDNQGYGGIQILTNLQHVAMSYDPATGLGSVFLDGRLVAVSNLAGVFLPSTNALHFGFDPQRNFTSNKVNVVVDDFGFWGRPLALNEIGRIQRDGALRLGKDRLLAASGLQALWPFDGNGADLVGTNLVALLGAWQVTGGQIGGGVAFPGSTAQGRTPPINLTGRTGFTLEGWVGAPAGVQNLVVAAFSPVVGQTGPALLVGFPPPLGNGPGSVSAVFRTTNGIPLVVSSAAGLVQPIRLATNVTYAVFSDRTNFSAGPIKFASPPFLGVASGPTLLAESGFETLTPGVLLPGAPAEGWRVVSNRVEVLAVGSLAHAGRQV
ncbi:MAG: proprotein convertase P-domain-containing protein, partial [Verrucomicrobiota bacterium]